MKVKSEREVAQSGPTLRDPMGCSPLDYSLHGSFQATVLEWGVIVFSSLVMREMQMKIKMIHHCTPMRRTKFKSLTTPSVEKSVEHPGLSHFWWKCKTAQLLGKDPGRFL